VYPYRAIDQFRQVIDMLVSKKRDLAATRRFFAHALEHGPLPSKASTDRAPAYPQVIDELLPAACHVIDQHANNPIESDHGQLTSRLQPMRGRNGPDSLASVQKAKSSDCDTLWTLGDLITPQNPR
jgi:IS6 family transposase